MIRRAVTLFLLLAGFFAAARGDAQTFLPRVRGVISSIRGANFNTTSDQAMPVPPQVLSYRITAFSVTNCTNANPPTSAVGGLYTAASKGGTAIVANTQVYSAITGSSYVLNLTLAAATNITLYQQATVGTIYLSLTTAHGTASTCDVYMFGDDLT